MTCNGCESLRQRARTRRTQHVNAVTVNRTVATSDNVDGSTPDGPVGDCRRPGIGNVIARKSTEYGSLKVTVQNQIVIGLCHTRCDDGGERRCFDKSRWFHFLTFSERRWICCNCAYKNKRK